jgi:glyoxylase-like metal-dependent hydrolase (beta-lactamase superfamily II)/rhodanese-related sulfurtransferase
MHIEQFYDKGLAHASYAILSEGEIALVDPGRDPKPYYDFAAQHQARIVAVIETHPHADFVSSHQEIARETGAKIYVHPLVGAEYAHQPFGEGDHFRLGKAELHALHTPGHSPDSICVLARDEQGQDHALFTGDTLFIGDVGRPDLRENAGNVTAQREALARQMYHSTRKKILLLADQLLVYPAHGAGSLCGKNLSSDTVSTLGRERRENYALQPMDEESFVRVLLEGQPFIPKYFGYDVDLNKRGAASIEESIAAVPRLAPSSPLKPGVLIIDGRPEVQFKAGHLPGSINLQDGGKFETWLGSIVGPAERFYLIAQDSEALEILIRKAAKIGYEALIEGALTAPAHLPATTPRLDLAQFRQQPGAFTIVDIRNWGEIAEGAFFEGAIPMPLPELRERAQELPTDRPVLVHCAGGYRSAAGSSIVQAALGPQVPVYDLSTAVLEFAHAHA